MKINKDDIRVGDIIYVSNPFVRGINIGSRPFLVWGYGKCSPPINQIMMLEISSEPKTGSDYPFNISIIKSTQNGLTSDSHIKADQLFIYSEYIIPDKITKMGSLEISKYAETVVEKRQKAIDEKKSVYYDQSNNGKALPGW